jgi:hypothetical protein
MTKGRRWLRKARLNRLDLDALRPWSRGRFRSRSGRSASRTSATRCSRLDYKLRIVIVGGAEAWRVAPELAREHVAVVLDPLAALPMTYDEIGARRDNAARLAKAGVTIAFTVTGQGIYLSYDAGSALREGAGVAVANGLPYADALRALTLNPAQIWGVGKKYGTLEPGRDADLVIWDGDPLEPRAHRCRCSSVAAKFRCARGRPSCATGTGRPSCRPRARLTRNDRAPPPASSATSFDDARVARVPRAARDLRAGRRR